MLGAAPRVCRLRVLVAAVCVAAGLLVPLAPAATSGSSASVSGLWAVQLPASSRTKLSVSLFSQLRQAGVGTLVVQRSGWQGSAHQQLVSLARRFKTRLVEPRSLPRNPAQVAALRAGCRGPRVSPSVCAVASASVDSARGWLHRDSVDFVVVRVAS